MPKLSRPIRFCKFLDTLIMYYFNDKPRSLNSEFCTLYATIRKTSPCNIYPLKPHFYTVKLGFAGVYLFFEFLAQKHRLWVLVRTASARRFYRVPTIYVLNKNKKNINFFLMKFQFLQVKKISIYCMDKFS